MLFGFDARKSRPVTCQVLDNLEQGMFDKDDLIRDLLNWLSEDEVKEFVRANDLLPDAGEPDDETESPEDETESPEDETESPEEDSTGG